MGKLIDRAALMLLCTVSLFVLFLALLGSIAGACILTFLCCALLFRRYKSRSPRQRMNRLEAEALMTGWAFTEDVSALSEIAPLLGKSPDDPALCYISRHPTASVTVGDVFAQWKNHRSLSSIVIISTCRADPRARTFARTLQTPAVEIIDSARLLPLIRGSDLTPPRIPRGRMLLRRLCAAFRALPERHPWRRSLLYGLLLLPVYLITGNAGYLFLSMGALFLSGISIKVRQ